MKKGPFFVLCKRRGCGGMRQVPSSYQQRRQKYCSRQCVGLAVGPVTKFTRTQRLAHLAKARRSTHLKAMIRLAGLSKIQVYRMAYSNGWKAGGRAERRRMRAAS